MVNGTDFDSLLTKGLLPINLRRLKPQSLQDKSITLSELENLQTPQEVNEFKIKNLMITADKVEWAAYSDVHGLYSCDGVKVVNSTLTGDVSIYRISDKLVPISHFNVNQKIKNNLKNAGGNVIMADKVNDQEKAVQDILKGLNQEVGAAKVAGKVVTDSTVFTNDAPMTDKELQKAKTETINKKLKATLSSAISDLDEINTMEVKKLHAFNYATGSIIGWLTNSEDKFGFKVKGTRVVGPNKKFVAKNRNPEIQERINRGEALSADDYEKEYKLVSEHSKPTTPKFAIVKAAVEGLVSQDLLLDENWKFGKPEAPKAYTILAKEKAELASFVSIAFGGVIQEDPMTHDTPGDFRVELQLVEVIKDDTAVQAVRPKLIPSGKSLLGAKNWFPRQTYVTVGLDGISNPETRKKIDEYLFRPLLKPTKAHPAGVYQALNSEDKDKIQVNGTNVVSSDFTDPAKALDIVDINPFTKVQNNAPKIPVVNFKEVEDGKFTASKETYDAASPKSDVNSEWSPFRQAKYKHFLDACEGQLTPEFLRGIYASSKQGKGKQAVKRNLTLSNNDALLMYKKALLVDEKAPTGIASLNELKASVEKIEIDNIMKQQSAFKELR